MSISSAIVNAQQKVANAYTAVSNKGGTLPSTQNLSNLPTAISAIPTGTSPTLASLTITPSTTAQSITPPSGTDGYNTISVSAVTSSIDSDITAGNIKSGVNILGVQGTVTELVGTTTTITSNGTYAPTSPSNGFTSVSVNVAGTTPSGTYTITANGTYDVTNYASADVSVSGGGGGIGIPREVVDGVFQIPASSFTFSLPSSVTDVGSYAMYYALQNCAGLTTADLSNLITLSGNYAMYYAFKSCTNLTSVDLSSLTTVSGNNAMQYAFYSCKKLTSVDLSSLTTLSGDSAMYYAFINCTKLTSVDLSSLTTVSSLSAMGAAFQNCTSLASLSFPALTSTSFGSKTNQFNSMLNGVTGCTVHFPSNLQSVIGSWSSVTSGFSGTNTTVLFDLPATT